MTTKGSYYEEYLRKHGALPVNRQGDDKLIADREAYIKFLEAQLQRVTAAVAHVDGMSDRLADQQATITTQSAQIVDLQDKVVKMTQLIQTVQQYSERQGKEAGLAVGNLHSACSRLNDRMDGQAEDLRMVRDMSEQVQGRAGALESELQTVSGQVQHNLRLIQTVQQSVNDVSQRMTSLATNETAGQIADAVQQLTSRVEQSVQHIEEARSAAYEAADSASRAADVSAGAEAAALAAGEQAAAAAAAAAQASAQAGSALDRAGEAAVLASSAEASVRSTIQLAVRTLASSPTAASTTPNVQAPATQGWSSPTLPSQLSSAVHGSLLTYERSGAGSNPAGPGPVGMAIAVGQAVERSVTAILQASTAEVATVQRSLLSRLEAAEEGCKRALSSQSDISQSLSCQVEEAVSGMQQAVQTQGKQLEAQVQAIAAELTSRVDTTEASVRRDVQQCAERVQLLEHSVSSQTKAVFAEVTNDVSNRMSAIETELAALRSAHGYTAKGLEADMQSQLAVLRRECLEAVHACREGLGQVTRGLTDLEGTVQRIEQEAAVDASRASESMPHETSRVPYHGGLARQESPARVLSASALGGGAGTGTASSTGGANKTNDTRLESRLESRAAASLANAAVEAATERMRLALGSELAELAMRVAEADTEYRALIARMQGQIEALQANVRDMQSRQGQESSSSSHQLLLSEAKSMIDAAESALHSVASDAIRTCASIADSAAELVRRAEAAAQAPVRRPQDTPAASPSPEKKKSSSTMSARVDTPQGPSLDAPAPTPLPAATGALHAPLQLPGYYHTGTFAATPAGGTTPIALLQPSASPSVAADGRITELLNGLAVLTREVSTMQQGNALARSFQQQSSAVLDISNVSLGGPLQTTSSAGVLHTSSALPPPPARANAFSILASSAPARAKVTAQTVEYTPGNVSSASLPAPVFSTAQGKKPVLRPVAGPLGGAISGGRSPPKTTAAGKNGSTPPKQSGSISADSSRPSSRQSQGGDDGSPSAGLRTGQGTGVRGTDGNVKTGSPPSTVQAAQQYPIGGPFRYASLPAWYQQRAAEIAQGSAGAGSGGGGGAGQVKGRTGASTSRPASAAQGNNTSERRKSRSQASEQEERHALEHALATSSISGHLTSALGSILTSARQSTAGEHTGASGAGGLQARGPSPQDRDGGGSSIGGLASGQRRLSTGSQASMGSTSVHVSGVKLGRKSSGRGDGGLNEG